MGFNIIACLLVLCLICKSLGRSIFGDEVTMFQIHQQLGWITVCVLMVGAQIDYSARQIIKKIEHKEQTQKETNEILQIVFHNKIKNCAYCFKPIPKEEDLCPFCGNTPNKNISEEKKFYGCVLITTIVIFSLMFIIIHILSSNNTLKANKYQNNNAHIPAAQLYK